jgi:hypothetical protein
MLIMQFIEMYSNMMMKFIAHLKGFVGCVTVLLKEMNVVTEQT